MDALRLFETADLTDLGLEPGPGVELIRNVAISSLTTFPPSPLYPEA